MSIRTCPTFGTGHHLWHGPGDPTNVAQNTSIFVQFLGTQAWPMPRWKWQHRNSWGIYCSSAEWTESASARRVSAIGQPSVEEIGAFWISSVDLNSVILWDSGNQTWPIRRSPTNGGFSIAMLDYQRLASGCFGHSHHILITGISDARGYSFLSPFVLTWVQHVCETCGLNVSLSAKAQGDQICIWGLDLAFPTHPVEM